MKQARHADSNSAPFSTKEFGKRKQLFYSKDNCKPTQPIFNYSTEPTPSKPETIAIRQAAHMKQQNPKSFRSEVSEGWEPQACLNHQQSCTGLQFNASFGTSSTAYVHAHLRAFVCVSLALIKVELLPGPVYDLQYAPTDQIPTKIG